MGTRGAQPSPGGGYGLASQRTKRPQKLGRSSPGPRSGHGWENSIFKSHCGFSVAKGNERGCVCVSLYVSACPGVQASAVRVRSARMSDCWGSLWARRPQSPPPGIVRTPLAAALLPRVVLGSPPDLQRPALLTLPGLTARPACPQGAWNSLLPRSCHSAWGQWPRFVSPPLPCFQLSRGSLWPLGQRPRPLSTVKTLLPPHSADLSQDMLKRPPHPQDSVHPALHRQMPTPFPLSLDVPFRLLSLLKSLPPPPGGLPWSPKFHTHILP